MLKSADRLNKGEKQLQTQHPQMSSTPEFEPGPHCWEANALTTAPSSPSKGKKKRLLLSPPQRLPFGIPVKIAISARGTMGRRVLSSPSHRPRALSFFPLPSPPATQRGLCGGVSSQCLNFDKFRQWHSSFNQCVNIVVVIRWTYQGG